MAMINTDKIFLSVKENLYLSTENEPTSLTVHVAEYANFSATFLTYDAPLDLHILLEGEHAKASLKCVYLSSNSKKSDVRFSIEHLADHTQSEQTIYGISSFQSSAFFEGKIKINPNLKQCKGNQNHHGLLLDKTAKITTIPSLEIYSNDVECTHGSFVGALDEQQLFYLNTRGISDKEAKTLLIQGFLSCILPQKYEPSVNRWIQAHV